MTDAQERARGSVGFRVAGGAVLVAGLVLVAVHGAAVVRDLSFVDEAVTLEAPGRYRVQAARASTWTLLQDLTSTGVREPVRVKVRAVGDTAVLDVKGSAQAYRYSRHGVHGFSAYDFRVPGAGEYEVELSSGAAVNLRLIDDVGGRLLHARRGMVRAAALGGGAVALACALFTLGVVARRRPRARVVAPRQAPAMPPVSTKAQVTSTRAAAPPPRSLQVLPALATSVALERYKLPAPQKPSPPRANTRPDTSRVPSVA